jgi:cytoskeletal protein CcmA (bactofilin family)
MWKKTEPEEPQHLHQQQPPPQPQTAAPARPPAQPGKERAMIGPSIEIKGDLSGGEDLHVEGRIEGKIDLKRHNVSIGKSGRVRADIVGKIITVEGEVHGNLFGEDQIILRHSSTVRGNLTAPRVTLEDGSNFKGSIDMIPKEGSPSPAVADNRSAAPSKPVITTTAAQPSVGGPKLGS